MLKADAVLWGSDLTSSPRGLPGLDPKVLPQKPSATNRAQQTSTSPSANLG